MFGKKKKDQDLFINPEEWIDPNSEELYEDDFPIDELDEISDSSDSALIDDDLESEEDEARYQQHLKLKKDDKIFNNSWNNGDGITDDTYSSTSIKIDPGHTDSSLLDSSRVDQYLDKSII